MIDKNLKYLGKKLKQVAIVVAVVIVVIIILLIIF